MQYTFKTPVATIICCAALTREILRIKKVRKVVFTDRATRVQNEKV